MPANAKPTIAVLTPVLNEAERIVAFLDHLVALGFDEIIVADGGSRDDTVARALGRGGAQVIRAPRGRGNQLDAAFQTVTADIVVMLHADTTLPNDARAQILAAIDTPGVSGGCFRLRFDDQRRLYRLYGWLTRFETALTTFGDQAVFARRMTLARVGGIPRWPLLEDVEIRRRLKRHGRIVKVASPVVTSARRFQRDGIVRGQMRNVIIMCAFWLGVSPERLSRYYDTRRR